MSYEYLLEGTTGTAAGGRHVFCGALGTSSPGDVAREKLALTKHRPMEPIYSLAADSLLVGQPEQSVRFQLFTLFREVTCIRAPSEVDPEYVKALHIGTVSHLEHIEPDLDPPMGFAELVAAQRAFLATLPDDFVDLDFD